MRGYVANTDHDWYEFLRARQPAVDEVNFWQPSGLRRFRAVTPGSPFFFRLKSPHNAIGGYGFFARNVPRVPAWYAWDAFGVKNGSATLGEMVSRVARYRRVTPTEDGSELIGCLMIAEPVFFPPDAWVAQPAGWHANVVQGSTLELDAGDGARLLRECLATAAALGRNLKSNEGSRYGEPTLIAPRLGQGTFRLAVTDAYRGCAVTTEHSLPVLEASHIRPYAEGGLHSVSNGILLRSDLHRLFDQGYITVSPKQELMVSDRLRRDFDNGRTYYQLAGRELHLPDRLDERPDAKALEWHRDVVWHG